MGEGCRTQAPSRRDFPGVDSRGAPARPGGRSTRTHSDAAARDERRGAAKSGRASLPAPPPPAQGARGPQRRSRAAAPGVHGGPLSVGQSGQPPAPHPAPAPPGVPGGRLALTFRARWALLSSAPPPPPPPGGGGRAGEGAREGPLHFLPPAAAAASPTPLAPGRPLRTRGSATERGAGGAGDAAEGVPRGRGREGARAASRGGGGETESSLRGFERAGLRDEGTRVRREASVEQDGEGASGGSRAGRLLRRRHLGLQLQPSYCTRGPGPTSSSGLRPSPARPRRPPSPARLPQVGGGGEGRADPRERGQPRLGGGERPE